MEKQSIAGSINIDRIMTTEAGEGSWMQTFSGKRVHPLNISDSEICIEDIAHALSLICRFGGHCPEFYSVAQHSVHVSEILPDELKLWGLMHDASEAYLVDLPRPVKGQMPEYKIAEKAVMREIAKKYGLSWPEPPEVKTADNIILLTEGRQFFGDVSDWEGFVEKPLNAIIAPWTPKEARTRFLNEFYKLTNKNFF